MFGKKLFDLVTPYNRIFLTIKLENDDVITLPAKHTATFFLQREDTIMLDETDDLEDLVWIDYELLDPKNNEEKFQQDFLSFKDLVKKELLKKENGNLFTLTIIGKVIYGKNCNIVSQISNI